MDYYTVTPGMYFPSHIQNQMVCPAFIPKVPPDEHNDLSKLVLDPRAFTSTQLSHILERLCLEVNWDFFKWNMNVLSKSCARDATALGLDYPAETFDSLWREVLDVYQGYLKGYVVRGQGYSILEIIPRDRHTGLETTTAGRMVGFILGYFVGCRYGWLGDRFQATLEALLEWDDFLPYIRQYCQENALVYWEGTGETWGRLTVLDNHFQTTRDLGEGTGICIDDLVLTRWL